MASNAHGHMIDTWGNSWAPRGHHKDTMHTTQPFSNHAAGTHHGHTVSLTTSTLMVAFMGVDMIAEL